MVPGEGLAYFQSVPTPRYHSPTSGLPGTAEGLILTIPDQPCLRPAILETSFGRPISRNRSFS